MAFVESSVAAPPTKSGHEALGTMNLNIVCAPQVSKKNRGRGRKGNNSSHKITKSNPKNEVKKRSRPCENDDDDGSISKRSKQEEDETTTTTTTTVFDPSRPFGTRKCPRKLDNSTFRKPRFSEGATAPSKSSSSEHIFAEGSAFRSLGVSNRLCNLLLKLDGGFEFKNPTHVQELAIPKLLQGKDALIKSETGSGKTLTYLLPIVTRLGEHKTRVQRSQGTRAVILLPTRELCVQIYEVLEQVLKAYYWIIPGILVGGDKRKAEKARLRKGVSILAATPGRLIDHLKNTESFKVTSLEYLVLDEADRLLDLGFEPQVTEILELLREKLCRVDRQNILISATLDKNIRSLADRTLRDPVVIDADEALSSKEDEKKKKFTTPQQLAQHFVEVPLKQRFLALYGFLRDQVVVKGRKVVVFLSCCDSVEYHHTLLRMLLLKEDKDINGFDVLLKKNTEDDAFPIVRLHGNMKRGARREALNRFCRKSNSKALLLCTDVAARGLNLPKVDWIAQFDPPHEVREYVHRVGRTARSGACGRSILFVSPSEIEYISVLANQGLELTKLSTNAVLAGMLSAEDKSLRSGTKARKNALINTMSRVQAKVESIIEKDDGAQIMAVKAYRSHSRAYAAHPKESKTIFRVRALHFGHLAKTFGLKEPPSKFGDVLEQRRKEKEAKKPGHVPEQNPTAISTKDFYALASKGRREKMLSEFAA